MGGLSLVEERGLLIRAAYLLAALGSEARGLQSWWHTGLVAPQHVGSCWTKDQTNSPSTGRRVLNHWTTKEV